jgi:hypothetical protein
MKALSGTFALKLIVLATVAIIAVLTFRAFAQGAPTPASFTFTLKIGKTKTEYVNVTTKEAFDRALCDLKAHGGDIRDIGFKKGSDATPTPIGQYVPECPTASINTDKVTTSELAKNAPAGESAANDPHAVYRVQSNSATDIKAVLDTFQ